jgi:hypothetical protein
VLDPLGPQVIARWPASAAGGPGRAFHAYQAALDREGQAAHAHRVQLELVLAHDR